jgi:hypothetical protein
MQEIISIIINVLRILQILIIMGSVVMFIYFGILFYLKKFDKVKENIIYPILGLALLILSYSIPVVIISFLERGQVSLDNRNISSGRSDKSTSSSSSGSSTTTSFTNFYCSIEGLFPNENPQIINDVDLISTTSGCAFNITINTQPYSSYVLCSFKPEIYSFLPFTSPDFRCWGIYYSKVNLINRQDSKKNSIIDYNPSFFYSQNVQNRTDRIFRLPSQDKYIFCETSTISSNYINLDRDGEYIYVIFRATPDTNLTSLCQSTSSQKVNANVWRREEWEAIKIYILSR